MKRVVFGLVLGAVVSLSAPAIAAVFQVTYHGTVSNAFDYQGVFGPSNTSLSGQSFTATLLYDSSLGTQSGSTPPSFDVLYGGSFYGPSSPLLSANLSIGLSAPVSIDGSFRGYINSYVGGQNQTQSLVQSDLAASQFLNIFIQSPTQFGNGPNVYSPFSYTVQSGDTVGGTFQLLGSASDKRASGSFEATDVTVSAVSETPVPAALPLFASALLGGGGLLWRRRRKLK